MLNRVIQFALGNRLIVLLAAVLLTVFGLRTANQLPIDVLPDITRPRVTVITECPNLAPEEVEALVTIPLETALNGASGAEAIRSSSDPGLSVIQVEFDWNQDIYIARQIVQERLAAVPFPLPEGIEPMIAPHASLLGQIMMIGIWSTDGTTSPMELRTLADKAIRKSLMQVSGVAQVIVMGGEKKQFQVLIDPHAAHQYEVSLAEIEAALNASNRNVTGGFLERTATELPVRAIGRIQTLADVEQIVVKHQANRPVLVRDLARVIHGPAIKRGDASINGNPAVVLTIQKQPGADTRALSSEIESALDGIRVSLPDDARMDVTYAQRNFIDFSVGNVIEAIRDGAILVVVVLFIFLMNVRTTLITLTAIPLSLLTTFLIFQWFGFSINVMTLGGIAVALGELVDDAIVDVENILRRLRDNALLPAEQRKNALQVIYEASSEVRAAIINSTIIVILVFIPLFALSGIEGRMFTPLGVAYIVSILASTVVSLTVTPVLSWYLLPRMRWLQRERDPIVLAACKWLARPIVRFSLTRAGFVSALTVAVLLFVISAGALWRIGKDFLPKFDEGASQVNLFLPPGASLGQSRRIAAMASERLQPLLKTETNPDGPLLWYTSKSGRAEDDEHVMGVNVTEITLTLNPDVHLKHDEMVDMLTHTLEDIPGASLEVEQPIGHLIGHMLSGVSAEIGIKLFGDDLGVLQQKASEIVAMMSKVRGLTAPVAEQQQMTPQLRIEMKREALARHGLTSDYVNRMIETAMAGLVIDHVLVDQQPYALLVRFDEPWRSDLDHLHRMPIETPDGTRLPLSELATIFTSHGPNTIKREDSRRRIIIRTNTNNRDLVSAVQDIEEGLKNDIRLPVGYVAQLGGEYQAQQSATRQILVLGSIALLGIVVVLYATFLSTRLVLQILIALPVGIVGGTAGLWLTDQTLSIAATVGFISLGGIAIRNGILLIEAFKRRLDDLVADGTMPTEETARRKALRDAITEGSLDRLAPVLMTTLTTGCALVPLVLGGNEPGKEILYPVATVILGGLITSAVAEYLLRPGLFYWWGLNAVDPTGDSLDEV